MRVAFLGARRGGPSPKRAAYSRHKRSTPLTMRAAFSMLGNTLSMMPRRAIMKSAPFAISALALGGGAPSAKADEPTYAPHFFYCIAE